MVSPSAKCSESWWPAELAGMCDGLRLERLEVHLDARVGGVPAGAVGELVGVEVGAEFAVEAGEDVAVEGGGDAGWSSL